MAIYSYYCFNCGFAFEKFSLILKYRKTRKCPKCGNKAYHDFVTDNKSGNVDSQMREYQFDSDTGTRLYTASYLPSQIEEAKRKHSGRDFKLINGAYLPVIKHRRDKLKYLKEYGYVELD